MTEFWNRKTYCIITGASQGIGRQIAIDFAKNVGDGSLFLLLARNLEKLTETETLMKQANSSIEVMTHSMNLAEPVGVAMSKIINLSLMHFQSTIQDFELALVVHNAGSLGDVTEPVTDMRNIDKINSYLVLNLYSVILLNAEFIRFFADQKKTEIAFINITSLCAIKPFPSMGYYCIGKSSREMYFSVLAAENPNLTVLSYAPGPVLTEMADEIIENVQNDEIKNSFVDMKNNSKMLTTEQTVGKLVDVLRRRAFTSGGRVDYYD